ncbi:MAG TPA: glycoside hydrolase family 88 protein, partial [Opitutus sp.]|nr:glycoside hydrolase family 88 protein [Opitutus sp.]
FLLPNGDLLSLHRDGASGNGSLVLNRYETPTAKWSAVHPNLIDGEGKRSPYWSMTVDSRGALHLAWTWRDSPDVATNHDLAYARSADGGLTWTSAAGAPLKLPLTAANADYAARIPAGSNLMNPPSIAADHEGRPVIANYWSPAPDAAPRFHLVRFDGSAWQTIPGPAAAAPFKLAGTATKRPPLSRAVVLTENVWQIAPLIHLVFRDDSRNSRVIAATLNTKTGEWSGTELTRDSVGAWEPAHDPVAWDRLKQFHSLVQNVQQADGNDRSPPDAAPTPVGSLIWSPEALRRGHLAATPAEPLPPAQLNQLLDPAAVLATAQRAADWHLANPPDPKRYAPRGWERAPFYIGALELDKLSADRRYRDAILKQSEENGWQPHHRIYHADDHCVIQAYAELYKQLGDARMLAPSKERLDHILANPSPALLDWNSPDCLDRWSWCDALFMGPVAWLNLWQITGDRRYLDFMNAEWWATTDRLYRPEIGFYFRDESYFDVREPNGKTVHWSRGNGWVFAGLARVLDIFPKDHPDHPRYLQLYHQMAKAVLAAQQPDGLWRPGLLDPAAHPARETSGSSFYTFGLAWGVNRGLLDRNTVEPAVRRAWNALVSCVREDGKLEHVQPIGAAPHGFDPHHTEPFGVGAFLLAASQTYRLAQPVK